MTDDERPLIDYERNRRQFEDRQRELAQHPERAQIVQRAVVRIVDNYRKEARTGEFTFASDEHVPVGEGSAPSPLQYFIAAVAFWLLSQLTRFASVQDVPIESAEMDVRATFPQARKYGLDPDAGVAMDRLSYTLDIKSPAPKERVARLVETAMANCHAENSLRVPVPVESKLRLNGVEVPVTAPDPPELRR